MFVLHYVEDALIAATSKEDCITATRTLLHSLVECSNKVKQPKIQQCQMMVTYLGRMISTQYMGLPEPQKQAIWGFPQPKRHTQVPWIMQLQLWLCTGLCEPHSSPERQWLLRDTRTCLHSYIGHQRPTMPSKTAKRQWTPYSATSLATHRLYNVHVDVVEKKEVLNEIMSQKSHRERRVQKYHIVMLDTLSQGHSKPADIQKCNKNQTPGPLPST